MSKNVLFFYSRYPSFTNAVKDYVQAFAVHSQHKLHYYDAELGPPQFDLEPFDCIIFNYCFWARGISSNKTLRKRISRYPGLKIAIFQDEYDYFLWHKDDVAEIHVDTIVTGVPPEHWRDVFKGSPFDRMHYIHALTGYVPESFLKMPVPKPMNQRQWAIGYRGRPVHFKYGYLTQEKVFIGQRMKEICSERGITANISLAEEDRIYGPKWMEFLGDCRTVLGTESGSNVFDFDGTLKDTIDKYLNEHPEATFETVHKLFIEAHEGKVRMNQVSPRIFEAIAVGTGLILFEGEYSGVIRPWEHFIPLKKDFSNVDDVLDIVSDFETLEAMTHRAHAAVIGSGRYHFRNYVGLIDAHINNSVPTGKGFEPIYGLIGWKPTVDSPLQGVKNGSLVTTDIPLQYIDRLPDPFFFVRIDPRAIQRFLFSRYIRIVSTKVGKRIQERLRGYELIYSMLRNCIRLLTGK